MTLLTLLRRAPVAPEATVCQLCNATLAGSFQDHLLVGQPGTAETRAVICAGCGEALARTVELFGPDLRILLKENQDRPIERSPRDQSASAAELDKTRQNLSREADTLGRTAHTLRAEAEKLRVSRPPETTT
jgi:hypothetical protein